jgi:uncharacterized membrane protein YkvI
MNAEISVADPAAQLSRRSSRFQRWLLPGLAFKAVVIGGGYATGRELAEFFLPSGPWGGLAGMVLAALIWSAVCVMTFVFARACGAQDYRTFFRSLLGKGSIVFEITYILFVILILAVFGAAAGAIGSSTFGLPTLVGTLALMAGITAVATYGNTSVERLFKYVSLILYAVYALFVVLGLTNFGSRIAAAFAMPVSSAGWALGGVTYAGYNIVGAVVILPIVRHMNDNRDALVAGLIAGPLAMIPGLLFFICMVAFYPAIGGETLPSDFLLRRLDAPIFHVVFQVMIFAALLESGTAAVHAINERIAGAVHRRSGRLLSRPTRLATSLALLIGCMLLAEHFGLVALIAKGYRALAAIFLAIYVLPLLTIGIIRLRGGRMQLEVP